MSVSFAHLRTALARFDWNEMFVERGWSRTRKRLETGAIDAHTWTLAPVAGLGGMVVYRCTGDTGVLPPSDLRRRIENKVKHAHLRRLRAAQEGSAALLDAVVRTIRTENVAVARITKHIEMCDSCKSLTAK